MSSGAMKKLFALFLGTVLLVGCGGANFSVPTMTQEQCNKLKGLTTDEVTEKLGEPRQIYPTTNGFRWEYGDPQGKQVRLSFRDDKCITAGIVLPITPKARELFTMTPQQRNELGGKRRHEVLTEFGQPSFSDFQRGVKGKGSLTTFYYDDVEHGKQVIVEFLEDECVKVDLK
jgi:hypothetical protein